MKHVYVTEDQITIPLGVVNRKRLAGKIAQAISEEVREPVHKDWSVVSADKADAIYDDLVRVDQAIDQLRRWE